METNENDSQMTDLDSAESHGERRRCYGDVVGAVRALGDVAVNTFLDELAPLVSRVAEDLPNADRDLKVFFHDWAVTAAALRAVGGTAELSETERRVALTEPSSVDDAIRILNSLVD